MSISLFNVSPNLPTEALVLNSYETFSSVRTLLLNLSNDLTGEHRDVALAIHQLSELGVMLVAQMMDREAPLPQSGNTVKNVGGGLLPMAVYQSPKMFRIGRHRRQAGSYLLYCVSADGFVPQRL